jgi:hypothetical protein
MAPQSKGGQKLQKQFIEQYKGQFLNTHKVHFMLFFCYYSSDVICKTSGGTPIALNRLK